MSFGINPYYACASRKISYDLGLGNIAAERKFEVESRLWLAYQRFSSRRDGIAVDPGTKSTPRFGPL
jgi:hypothetical protein